MADLKVRLDDGSEVGPMDLDMVRTWFQHGLLTRDSLVQRRGSTRWVRLSDAMDLSRWQPSGTPAGRARRAGRTAAVVAPDGTPGDEPRWASYVAAALLALVAAAALVVAFRPSLVRPELDDAPWLQIGLFSLVLGLFLVRGWEIGRRVVRVVCALAVAAAFPVAGVFVARGMRAEALLALASAVVLALGLVLLLAPRRSTWAAGAALLVVGLGASGIVRFARAEAGTALEVGAWASAERRLTDPEIGLDLALPAGWVALQPGNPLVPPTPGARVALAQSRVSGFAFLLSEPPPSGVLALEHYLDEVIARRRVGAAELEEHWRRDGRMGALGSRRAALRRVAREGRFAERVVVARDADRYLALVTWVPEEGGGRALEEAEALEAATTFSAVRSRSRGEAVQTAALELPHLSREIIERLVEAEGPAPAAALFRRAAAATFRGIAALGPEAARELRAIATASLASLPYGQRAPLADYPRRAAAGQPAAADEDERMCALAKAATLRLSPAQRARLQQLHAQAIRAALANAAPGSGAPVVAGARP
jgi:hypothetical protein